MIVMIDIPHEEILKAAEEIKRKKGICKILPSARFDMIKKGDDVRFDLLVCDDRMGGKNTGTAAGRCKNCKIKES